MWPSIERAARYVRAGYVDVRMFLAGKAERDIPPLRLRFVGSGDFRTVGDHLLALTKTRGQINKDSRILDIGCGSGRLALPLTRYLSDGEYEGFDVAGPAIRWCKRNVTRRHPHFRFRHVSLRNSDYSAVGNDASRFVFPFEEARFDCVVAYSVFTHLQFDEVQNYLRESYRVLQPGGRLVATFFLLNAQSRAAQRAIPQVQQFPYETGPIGLAIKSNPAFAVAIEESVLQQLLEDIGFRQIGIESGGWYGLHNAAEFQDLVVCTK